jgi:tetratricopeptide (TPR) repeat protein
MYSSGIAYCARSPALAGGRSFAPSKTLPALHRGAISPRNQRSGQRSEDEKKQQRGRVASALPAYEYLAEGLELPVQLVYLTTLLGFLLVGAFVVVQQVLYKREMEEAAKNIGERVRNEEASPEDYFELGVILLRKKLFTQANQNLKKALKNWDNEVGDSEILAQVHNALGYSYFNLDRFEEAIKQYRMAVDMQPGYLTAWNNLGDVLEKQKKYSDALAAYQEVLGLDPTNNVAKERANWCKTRVERSQGML